MPDESEPIFKERIRFAVRSKKNHSNSKDQISPGTRLEL